MQGYRLQSSENDDSSFPFVAWGGAGLVGIGGTAVLAWLLSEAALEFTAFMFGGIGLVVSALGFGFTIWQLRRTEKATDAATNALERARKEFATLDVLAELHAVRSSAEATREHMLGGRWPAVSAGYDRVREKLMRIVATPDQLTDQESEEAKDHVAHILGASGELETLNAGDPFETAPLTNRLKELENFTFQVEYRIKDIFRAS